MFQMQHRFVKGDHLHGVLTGQKQVVGCFGVELCLCKVTGNSLKEVMARPRHELAFMLECAGNSGLPFFWGGIGNARWAVPRATNTNGPSGRWIGPTWNRANTPLPAVDTRGKVQPTPDDPRLANKYTYWESNGQITRRVVIE